MCGIAVPLKVFSDSSAARGMTRRTGTGRVKHLDIKYLWIQGAVRDGKLSIEKIDTSLNTVDLGTKYHPSSRHHELIAMMPFRIGKELEQNGMTVSCMLSTSEAEFGAYSDHDDQRDRSPKGLSPKGEVYQLTEDSADNGLEDDSVK